MKVIAESAFNHNGDLAYLKNLAIASKDSGADYFTVQVLFPDYFSTKDYSKYSIYVENSFSEEQWIDLFDYCKSLEINLIPCVLDSKAFEVVYNYGFRFVKIHSTDIINIPLLERFREKKDCEFILETQCSTYQDISLCMSYVGEYVKALFHGYSNYPTEGDEIKLNSIDQLKYDFPGLEYGFADHTLGRVELPLMALAKGYDYIEKHIALDRNDRHYDWQVSLNPQEFSEMTSVLKNYKKVLGNGTKHPTKTELGYRDIIFKKVISKEPLDFKRSGSGKDFLSDKISLLKKENVGIALIARLKSQRLKKKVLLNIGDDHLIINLYKRLDSTPSLKKVFLATSTLEDDNELVSLFKSRGLNVFTGHPMSVIDRMLSLAIQENWGGIFRVTGDNPFTDPFICQRMIEHFINNDLDYVKAIGLPFGVTAELFSTQYLWELYLNMDNPLQSEYLTWFVINDENAKKGVIKVISDKPIDKVNLSVDYEEDYKRCLALFSNIGKSFESVSLSDIMQHVNLEDLVDLTKDIKLPKSKIPYIDYINMQNNLNWCFVEEINEKEL